MAPAPDPRAPGGARADEAGVPGPLDGYRIDHEPYYHPVADEVAVFEAAYRLRLPLMLKGPTGCGKSRFVEYMAWRLGRPLVTLACNEDLGAADLIGRWLLDAEGTRWQDGPLTLAARHGAICYLDELVEARPDVTVAIHPLADTRRILPIERRNEVLHAHPDFYLVASFNPGYHAGHRDLKVSTRQRFSALEFDYPESGIEVEIVAREAGVAPDLARRLVAVGHRSRRLKGHGLAEGASTRMLIHAGALIRGGIAPALACRAAIVYPASDDADIAHALAAAVGAEF